MQKNYNIHATTNSVCKKGESDWYYLPKDLQQIPYETGEAMVLFSVTSQLPSVNLYINVTYRLPFDRCDYLNEREAITFGIFSERLRVRRT